MAGMEWSLDVLPDELLLKILCCNAIHVRDLGRIAKTCSRLKRIVETPHLWRIKLTYRLPVVWEEVLDPSSITDWRDETRQLVSIQREVRRLVRGLSRRLIHCTHLTTPVYHEVDALVASTPHASLYMMYSLRHIVQDGPQHPKQPVELTHVNPQQAQQILEAHQLQEAQRNLQRQQQQQAQQNPPRQDDDNPPQEEEPNEPPQQAPHAQDPPLPPAQNPPLPPAQNSPRQAHQNPPRQAREPQPRPNWQRVLPRSSRCTERYENLTEKHYAQKVMDHVYQELCRQEWTEFLARPPQDQPLETGAMLVTRWFQPYAYLTMREMIRDLDKIALDCLEKLGSRHPDHPALKSPIIPPSTPLKESRWSQDRCRQLFKFINHILFSQMKLQGNTEDYYSLNNSFINEVLRSKRGIPITLCIIYFAVCHRLGIFLEPVNYPTHFLLSWKVPGTDEYEYIDAFHKGRRLTKTELMQELPVPVGADSASILLEDCTPGQVCKRMIGNIMNVAQMQAHISDHMGLFCPATELLNLITPHDRDVQELLLRIYYTLEIYYDRIVIGCQNLLAQAYSPILEEMLQDSQQILQRQMKDASAAIQPITPSASRCSEITYATGLVMRHKRYNYTCVIFGWDKECRMNVDWVRRMGVHNLKYKTMQPFYKVLVSDGSNRYAAQENLDVACEPKPVPHPDIGKFFKEFTGTHYIPNDELAQLYPEDEEVRNDTLRIRGW
ncbi:hypothetical protein Pcinc_001658 [Petrolisthes cinctipes]|uniref:Hemimethylated DNA-binding domain-containing protein n=1 Tax=Petrolisthes cinctipes TaxID=88211 RepID=A0AAE1GKB1_PETCI|nr:hypothetical protein Pcinc_001658 [Petrolisthes cinctipes]